MRFKTIINLTTISHHLWVGDIYLPWAISQNEPIASHQCTISINYAIILKAFLKEFVFKGHFDFFFHWVGYFFFWDNTWYPYFKNSKQDMPISISYLK